MYPSGAGGSGGRGGCGARGGLGGCGGRGTLGGLGGDNGLFGFLTKCHVIGASFTMLGIDYLI